MSNLPEVQLFAINCRYCRHTWQQESSRPGGPLWATCPQCQQGGTVNGRLVGKVAAPTDKRAELREEIRQLPGYWHTPNSDPWSGCPALIGRPCNCGADAANAQLEKVRKIMEEL